MDFLPDSDFFTSQEKAVSASELLIYIQKWHQRIVICKSLKIYGTCLEFSCTFLLHWKISMIPRPLILMLWNMLKCAFLLKIYSPFTFGVKLRTFFYTHIIPASNNGSDSARAERVFYTCIIANSRFYTLAWFLVNTLAFKSVFLIQ